MYIYLYICIYTTTTWPLFGRSCKLTRKTLDWLAVKELKLSHAETYGFLCNHNNASTFAGNSTKPTPKVGHGWLLLDTPGLASPAPGFPRSPLHRSGQLRVLGLRWFVSGPFWFQGLRHPNPYLPSGKLFALRLAFSAPNFSNIPIVGQLYARAGGVGEGRVQDNHGQGMSQVSPI